MAQYPPLKMTTAGLSLVAQANASQKALKFLKIVVGDGTLTSQNIATLTSVIQPKKEFPFTSGAKTSSDQFQLNFALSNSDITAGFFAREIGVYAKLDGQADSAAILVAYTNGGNFSAYIPDKSSPISSKIFQLSIFIGDSTNATFNKVDGAFITLQDLDLHDRNQNAHGTAINYNIQQHNQNANAHPLITASIARILGSSNFQESPVKNLKNISTLLGEGGIVASKLDRDNGYVKFANGFIIQWGLTWFQNQNTYCDVTLPISCNVLIVLATDDLSNVANRGDEFFINWNSGFSNNNRTSIRLLTNRGNAGNFTWLCIGRA